MSTESVEDYLEKGWMKILRSGTFIDKHGKRVTFTVKRLSRIADNYKPEEIEAPLIIGHEMTDGTPAKGWIEGLKQIGDFLLAKPKELTTDMLTKLREKAYKYVSASFNRFDELLHVAFVPMPAVSRLGPVNPEIYAPSQFSANDDGLTLLSFDVRSLETEDLSLNEQDVERKFKVVGELFQRLYENFIEMFGLEDAGRILNRNAVDYIKEYPVNTVTDEQTNYSKNTTGENPVKEETLEDKKVTKVEPPPEGGGNAGTVELSVFQKKEAENVELRCRLDEIEKKSREKEVTEFAEALSKEGYLKPVNKELFLAFMSKLPGQDKIEFSSGTGTMQLSMMDSFKELVKGFKNPVPMTPLKVIKQRNTGERDNFYNFSKGEVSEGDEELHERALQIMSAEKCDYETAVLKASGGEA